MGVRTIRSNLNSGIMFVKPNIGDSRGRKTGARGKKTLCTSRLVFFRPASILLTFGVGLKTTLCAGVVERDEMESVEAHDVGLELVEVEASDVR